MAQGKFYGRDAGFTFIQCMSLTIGQGLGINFKAMKNLEGNQMPIDLYHLLVGKLVDLCNGEQLYVL